MSVTPPPIDVATLEDRKIKEIEHSRTRRKILQGFERISDTNKKEEKDNIDVLIRDKEAYKQHFSNIKYYSIAKSSEEYMYEWIKGKCGKNIKVLDYGCGNGENGIYAAKCGSDVVGIDISPEGVNNANLNALQEKVNNRCKFEVMDGENMTFKENSFDVAVEYGVLHHVDLDKAMSELNRVLKPNGEMIGVEALRHNPIIHWYRKRTPHLRTEWEANHILRVQDLEVIKKYFEEVEVKYFHLLSLAAVPFRKTKIFHRLRYILDKMDKYLLSSQLIGKYGWIMVIVIKTPKKI